MKSSVRIVNQFKILMFGDTFVFQCSVFISSIISWCWAMSRYHWKFNVPLWHNRIDGFPNISTSPLSWFWTKRYQIHQRLYRKWKVIVVSKHFYLFISHDISPEHDCEQFHDSELPEPEVECHQAIVDPELRHTEITQLED